LYREKSPTYTAIYVSALIGVIFLYIVAMIVMPQFSGTRLDSISTKSVEWKYSDGEDWQVIGPLTQPLAGKTMFLVGFKEENYVAVRIFFLSMVSEKLSHGYYALEKLSKPLSATYNATQFALQFDTRILEDGRYGCTVEVLSIATNSLVKYATAQIEVNNGQAAQHVWWKENALFFLPIAALTIFIAILIVIGFKNRAKLGWKRG